MRGRIGIAAGGGQTEAVIGGAGTADRQRERGSAGGWCERAWREVASRRRCSGAAESHSTAVTRDGGDSAIHRAVGPSGQRH